jgi:hypothetical protein
MSHRPFHPSELDGVADPLESADLLLMARELERLDGGPIRPSDGFTDRVLAAIAEEPLPAPMGVAGLAARQGRLGAMVAALRDTWHVAWSGGRPMAVRAQAMAFVLLLIVAVGSVGAVTTVGAFNVLFPTTSSPSPTLPVTNPTPQPARTAEPTETAEPTDTPEPTESVQPSETPEPGKTAEPTETEKPHGTDNPGHTSRPGHTDKPEPTETPETDDSGGGSGSGGGGDPGETEHP